MNSKTFRAKYLKSAILIISLCLILGAISACLPNISIPTLEDNTLSDTAMTITQNSTDGLGEFNDGYSYVYTDKELIDKYRADDPNTPYDISAVKVDKTQARGAQDNPYVIASVEDWTRFAKNLDDGSIASYGSGKYFVLANDIDFDGTIFRPIRFFNGTFYGMGHKLQNISLSGTEWQYWNGSAYAQIPTSGSDAPLGYGIFCKSIGSTITDLIVENFNYQSLVQTSSNGRSTLAVGGLIGFSTSNSDAILNCHLVGEIRCASSYTQSSAGGLVGLRYMITNGSSIILYRCTSDVTIHITNAGSYPGIGALMGDGIRANKIDI